MTFEIFIYRTKKKILSHYFIIYCIINKIKDYRHNLKSIIFSHSNWNKSQNHISYINSSHLLRFLRHTIMRHLTLRNRLHWKNTQFNINPQQFCRPLSFEFFMDQRRYKRTAIGIRARTASRNISMDNKWMEERYMNGSSA